MNQRPIADDVFCAFFGKPAPLAFRRSQPTALAYHLDLQFGDNPNTAGDSVPGRARVHGHHAVASHPTRRATRGAGSLSEGTPITLDVLDMPWKGAPFLARGDAETRIYYNDSTHLPVTSTPFLIIPWHLIIVVLV
jgi:hypothetical protein